MEEKVLAESLFRYKKENYQELVPRPFVQFRLSKFNVKFSEFWILKFNKPWLANVLIHFFIHLYIGEDELKYFEKNIKQFDEKIVYACQVTKIDR